MTTKIEWTDETWNPVTGCTKVSDGCKHCYAERTWKRLSANPATAYYGRKFTDVQCHPEKLDQPLRWTKPRRIFVNSMSDLFHEDVPFEFIASVFAIMGVTTRHTYQILTKRPERMLEFFKWAHEEFAPDDFAADDRIFDHWPKHVPWERYDSCGPRYPYENVWLGVSVENQQTADERIPLLLQTPAAVRWLSIEPMLGVIDLTNIVSPELRPTHPYDPIVSYDVLTGHMKGPDDIGLPKLDWIVLGGESGPKARPMHPEWVRSVRDQCQAAEVPFFFKQWGEHRYIEAGAIQETKADPVRDIEYGPAEIVPGRFVKCGKKTAGRTLDGQTWEEYPA